MKILSYSLIFFLLSNVTLAQMSDDCLEFLKEVNKNYNDATSYEMLVKTNYLDQASKSIHIDSSFTAKSMNNLHTKIGSQVIIKNNAVLLNIDFENETMVLSEVPIEIKTGNENEWYQQMQENKNAYKDYKDGQYWVIATYEMESFKTALFYFNIKNKTLEKVIYHIQSEEDEVNENPVQVVIDYEQIKLNHQINNDYFNISKYVQKNEEKWSLTSSYAHFSLSNNNSQNP